MKIKFNNLNKIVGAMLLVILCIPCSYATLDEEDLSKLRAGGVVDLSGMGIGVEEAKEVANILKESSSIITLYLGYNQIDALGVLDVAGALERNSALTALDLQHNRIGSLGAREIADVLKKNTTLTIINLSHNLLGDAGVRELAIALKTNTALTRLIIFGNEISETGMQALVGAIIQNFVLERVEVDLVCLTLSQQEILQSVFARNKLIAKIMARIKRKVWHTLSLGGDAKVGVNSPLQLLDFRHMMPAIMERVDVRDYYNERVLHTIMHGTLEEVQQLLATDARDPAFVGALNEIRVLQMKIYKLQQPQPIPAPPIATAAAAAQQPVPQELRVSQMEVETQANLTSADIERLLQPQGQLSQLAVQSCLLL